MNQGDDWIDISIERNAEDSSQGQERSDDQDVQSCPSERSSHPEVEADTASSMTELQHTKPVKDKPGLLQYSLIIYGSY